MRGGLAVVPVSPAKRCGFMTTPCSCAADATSGTCVTAMTALTRSHCRLIMDMQIVMLG